MNIIKGSKIFRGNSKKIKYQLFALTIIIIGIYVVFKLFPLDKYHIYPPCPWHYITKTYCPGCGTMRGINSVVNGDIFGLFKYNILAALTIPFLIYSYINLLVKVLFKYRLPIIFLTKLEIYILLFCIIIYGILRNFVPILSPV